MTEVATNRQKQLLSIIYQSIRGEGFPPSFEDMRLGLKVASNQAVLNLLNALEKKKLIRREDKSARSLVILPLGYRILKKDPLIPALGTARAGTFTQSMELTGEWSPVSKDVTRFQSDVFIIKVNGDSMINAQIEDGATLLVQRADHFVSKDIVVAHGPDGETVKRFISQDSPPYMFLQPENPKYDIILFSDDIELQGKIVAKLEGAIWRPFKQGQLV